MTIVMSVVTITAWLDNTASARVCHRHVRHHASRHINEQTGLGLAAGATLGLLGAGIAGAAAANNGYGFPFPAYGQGNSGFGYYGPGYGYYGY